ncbi:MAG: M20/M25/M40 family metallo-hydrolase [Candidatus Eisenbacteria bacterium]|nr:M20/M25/M40 family metallo-hydrolase [Candidatus Eisenbacteria bacterium]
MIRAALGQRAIPVAILALIWLLPLCTAAQAAAPEPPWPAAVSEFKSLLADLVALDTTNPPGNELAAARRLKLLFDQEGIPCTVYESAPGRGNLVARLKGSGKKRPLLFLAHLDVVGVEKDKWASDPFQMAERDGALYGRGVIDDKGMAAGCALTLVWLHRAKVPLDRDVIFLAEADEESGSTVGVDWMQEHHAADIAAEYAINEGGATELEQGRVRYLGLQTSQKRFVNYTVTATGTAGHSSMPPPDNAIVALARALPKIAAPLPARLTPTTREFFRGVAEIQTPAVRAVMEQLEDSTRLEEAAKVVEKLPGMETVLRSTVVPTILKAGSRSNVIPGSAEATVNARLLPGTDPEVVRAELERRAGEPGVKVTFKPYNRPEPPHSDFAGPVVEAARRIAARLFPGAPVVPIMSSGATDSGTLRAAGMQAYGIDPFPLEAADAGRMHGNDERLPLKSIEPGLRLLYGIAREVAAR